MSYGLCTWVITDEPARKGARWEKKEFWWGAKSWYSARGGRPQLVSRKLRARFSIMR